jgi:hypothetical protein
MKLFPPVNECAFQSLITRDPQVAFNQRGTAAKQLAQQGSLKKGFLLDSPALADVFSCSSSRNSWVTGRRILASNVKF